MTIKVVVSNNLGTLDIKRIQISTLKDDDTKIDVTSSLCCLSKIKNKKVILFISFLYLYLQPIRHSQAHELRGLLKKIHQEVCNVCHKESKR